MIDITGKTKLFGVIGNPIKHTFSPKIHNFLFKKFNLDAVYVPIEVEKNNLKDFVNGIKSIRNFVGLNVTVPFKNQIAKLVDKTELKSIPINTVKIVKNKVYGYNTDIYGFKKALRKNFPQFYLKGKNVLLLGAGGAASAVAISVIKSKIKKLVIVNRTVEKAEKLKRYLKKMYKDSLIYTVKLEYDILDKINDNFDLIVNATSIGLKNEKSLISFKGVRDCIAYDLIYNPPMTDFLIQAQKSKLHILNGLDMLIFQALKSFQIWTGKNPDKYYNDIRSSLVEQ